ncbi:hypothetical protein IFM89_004414 [Coptis chinensis]|uniref:Ty3-gypsy retrotransposon protein n=1 Tax=Coptis chinensis TaxID=261450 RepID=A0A835IJR5_9MAGN|nr:hypothetical protein IFM89_004414 [Coptis chinensis]
MRARREKGLCYNCDDQYKPGHHCKSQQLYMLVASDETQEEEEEVQVANGERTMSKAMCTQLKWEMQGHSFEEDIRLLPLGRCDMVLGGDWIKKCGDVLINLNKL